jgi:hypothetical protein
MAASSASSWRSTTAAVSSIPAARMDTALWCGPITHAPSVTAASRNVEVTDDRAIVRWVHMYLREGTVPLEDVDESRAELAEEDVVEEAAEEAAVVLERLERDPLRDVVRRVRHPSFRVLLPASSSSISNGTE